MALRRFPLALLLLLCPALAISDEEPPVAGQAVQPIRFVTADVWPWGYRDEQGKPAGLVSQLAERLAELSGLPLYNRVLPQQRLMREFQRDGADFTIVFKNPTLDAIASNQGTALRTNILLVTRLDSRLPLTLEGLAGHKVGYIRGTYYGEAFAANKDLIKVPVHYIEQALVMLKMGRLDALISSDLVLHHTLVAERLDPKSFRMGIHKADNPGYLYMSPRPQHPEHAAKLRSALEQMRRSGELDALFRHSLHPASLQRGLEQTDEPAER